MAISNRNFKVRASAAVQGVFSYTDQGSIGYNRKIDRVKTNMNVLIHFTTLNYNLYNGIARCLGEMYPGSKFGGIITAAKDVKGFLEWTDISESEFWEVADSFRRPEVWENDNGKWRLRYPLI